MFFTFFFLIVSESSMRDSVRREGRDFRRERFVKGFEVVLRFRYCFQWSRGSGGFRRVFRGIVFGFCE